MWEFIDIQTGRSVEIDTTNGNGPCTAVVRPTVENTIKYCFGHYDDLLRRLGDE